jgi:hypothetical protein
LYKENYYEKNILFFLLVLSNIYAQKFDINDLQTPASPAFVLFGIEPNSIERPTTPKEAAASFVSSIVQGGSFDIAPYWLASHPDLTFDDYYNADVAQTILQTLSVSFATTPVSLSDDALGTRIGLGARWMFIDGNPRDTLKSLRELLKEKQFAFLETEDPAIEAEIKNIALAIQSEDHNRVGFRLEMAAASTMNFPGNDFKSGKFDKWGAWLTGAYLLENSTVDFLGLVRILGNTKEEGDQNVLDLGTRLVILLSKFNLSLEYINRSELSITSDNNENNPNETFSLESTNRISGNIKYTYNNEISVFMTLGKDYSTQSKDNPLIVQVGFNFGLGEVPIIY